MSGIPAPLWRRVALAPHRVLMLDYDGTLAPFTADRDQARPLPESVDVLRRIGAGAHTTLAVVSGRPLRELEQLVGDLPAVLVGEHGWETRTPRDGIVQHPLAPELAAILDEAERRARALGWNERIERKRAAVVLHTRTLQGDLGDSLRQRCAFVWLALTRTGRVSVDEIDGGLELRAREHHKGTVVNDLRARAPAGSLGVFVGDDRTDEDAFSAVQAWGFGVRVGPASRPSLAIGRLTSLRDVPQFLERWLEVARDDGGKSA